MAYKSKYTGAEVEEILDSTGNKVDKVDGKQLSTEDFTTALKNKLDDLSNYDDTAIKEAVEKLRTDFDTLVSGDSTTAIKTFNEIIAFLDGIEDSESLDSIIASIEQQIAAKYTKPSTGIPKTDLASSVQTSLGKADTALQSHQDISGKQDKGMKFTNLTASEWVEDSTYEDYPYRCDLSCSGVVETDYAEVVFSLTDAVSGNYAPICVTSTGVVSIWSAVNETITIPTILIVK